MALYTYSLSSIFSESLQRCAAYSTRAPLQYLKYLDMQHTVISICSLRNKNKIKQEIEKRTHQVTVNDKLYIFGGSCAATCAHRLTIIFDPATNSWSRGPDLLIERKGHSSIIINGNIYHFFGRSAQEFDR